MQLVDNQNRAEKQNDAHALMPHGADEILYHDTNALDHDLWRGPERIWHLENEPLYGHQTTTNVFGYTRNPLGGASSSDFHTGTNFYIPPQEWPSDPMFDNTCGRHENPSVSSNAILYHHPNLQRNPAPPPPPAAAAAAAVAVAGPAGRQLYGSPLSPVSSESPGEDPTVEKKRSKNRLAAARCRKKAKRGVDALQQRERDLLRENKALSVEAGLLKDEVLQLKTEILRHSECDNDHIHRYIQRSAEQVGGPKLGGDAQRTQVVSPPADYRAGL